MRMTFDNLNPDKFPTYTHALQISHTRYLNILKQGFNKRFVKYISYDKSPEDFDRVKVIGRGSFGTVYLVLDKMTFEYHAMKAIEKAEIIKKKNIRQIYLEKKILQCLNFPFVTSLDFSCKDNLYVYLILPYEVGGQLYAIINKLGSLSEPLSQFYAAQIVLALEYLHHCSVIHRDVKPENVLICESGYIKLADFGFSKILKNRTWTLCGTPEYLAPEIIMAKGYSFSVDWWALGILIYEMNAAYPPFYNSNPMNLYEKILTGRFKTPEYMTTVCKSLVKNLLEVDPIKRFGSLKAGVYDIKSHPWFREIDWYSILHQKIIAPYIPMSKNLGEATSYSEVCDKKLKKSPKCLFEEEFQDF